MPRPKQVLLTIYERLHDAFGPQHWWPAKTREEVVIGAVLAQNTAWTNVERAIQRLRQVRCLTLAKIHALPSGRLAKLILPAGTYRIKAQRLKGLAAWVQDEFDGDLDALFALGIDVARERLLAVKGIGPETADAILLYAGKLPTFVVDAYTIRAMRRHFLVPTDAKYEDTKRLFERHLPADEPMFNQYHALFVELGKRYCRPRARCEDCPLADLPHDGEL